MLPVKLPVDADIGAVITAAGGDPAASQFAGAYVYDPRTGEWSVNAPSQAALDKAAQAYLANQYPADQFAASKAAKMAALAAQYETRLAAGCTVSLNGANVTFPLDPASMLSVTAETVVALNQGRPGVPAWDTGEFWMDIGGKPVTIGTAGLAVSTGTAIRGCFKACVKNRIALAQRIAAAANQAALGAVDITAGWPA